MNQVTFYIVCSTIIAVILWVFARELKIKNLQAQLEKTKEDAGDEKIILQVKSMSDSELDDDLGRRLAAKQKN